jgi:hypothetical protein
VQKVEELLQGSPFIKRVLKSGVFPGLIFTDSFIHSSALIRRGRIEGVQSYFLEGARLWHKANLFVDRLRKGAPSESRVRRDKQNSCLVGREFDSYVNYSPGMDPRGVDWRAYARTDRLVFKRGVSVVDLSRAHTVFYLDRDLKDGDSTQRIYDLIAHLYRHEIGQKSRIPQSLEIRLGYGSLFTIQADHLREILLKDNLISDRYGSRSQLVDLLLSLQFLDESFVEKEGLSGGSWIGPVPIESAVPISKHMIFNVWAPEDCFFHPDSSSFIKRISASGSVLYRYTT